MGSRGAASDPCISGSDHTGPQAFSCETPASSCGRYEGPGPAKLSESCTVATPTRLNCAALRQPPHLLRPAPPVLPLRPSPWTSLAHLIPSWHAYAFDEKSHALYGVRAAEKQEGTWLSAGNSNLSERPTQR